MNLFCSKGLNFYINLYDSFKSNVESLQKMSFCLLYIKFQNQTTILHFSYSSKYNNAMIV